MPRDTDLPRPMFTAPALQELQKVSAAAALNNLIINPVSASAATITSPASAPSTTGFTTIGVVAASFTANTTAGDNVLRSVSSIAGLVVGQFVAEMHVGGNSVALPSNIFPGAYITAIGTTTVTLSRPSTGTATGITVKAATDQIDWLFGVPVGINQYYLWPSGATGGNFVNPPTAPYNALGSQAIEFMTDVANFTTAAAGIMFAGSNGSAYRIAIDDVYQTSGVSAFGSTSANWVTIQFAAQGVHKVRVEVDSAMFMGGVYVLAPGSVWAPKAGVDLRIGCFGDSYFQGGGAGSWAGRNLAAATSELLGCKFDLLSVGGTGYVNYGGVNYAWTSPYRWADTTRRNYDALLFFGSVNDAGSTAAVITPAALATWQGIRALNPKTPMIIGGCPATINLLVGTPTTQGTAAYVEAALQAAFTAWGDSNSVFIPVTNDPDGPWITAASAAGGYIMGDGVHPTDPMGVVYLAQRLATKIRAWVDSRAPF